MQCIPCFSAKRRKRAMRKEILPLAGPKLQYRNLTNTGEPHRQRLTKAERALVAKGEEIKLRPFRLHSLATATDNFNTDNLLGRGGFGRVYRGTLDNGQVVAVKQLDKTGSQGNKEFVVEVMTLGMLRHPNLVQLVGFCASGNQSLLVYEYMPKGSLNTHLFGIPPEQAPLSWYQRMKIALGTALGLEYLHENGIKQVIYRDLKCANILLDEHCNPKISDFGLAKPIQTEVTVTTQVVGTFGYFAPEYTHNGELSVKIDVYSFGVVMLELITGRQAVDNTRPPREQNLVTWARSISRDQKRMKYLADPLLKGHYPWKGLNQALAVALMCLEEVPKCRPMMSDVVVALMQLVVPPEEEPSTSSSHLGESSRQKKPLLPQKYRTLAEALHLGESSQQKEEPSTSSSHLGESSRQKKPPLPQKYRTLAEALHFALETVAEEEKEDEDEGRNKAQNSGSICEEGV